jgi:hypothetical protein
MLSLLSTDHFSVDGTLIEAWASMKSFKSRDGSDEPPASGGGRNAEADFPGQKRSNETHASTTDPEARLYRKGSGKEAKLCFMGHALMENRNGSLRQPTPALDMAKALFSEHRLLVARQEKAMAGPVRARQPVSGRLTGEAKSLPGGPIREHRTTWQLYSVAVTN